MRIIIDFRNFLSIIIVLCCLCSCSSQSKEQKTTYIELDAEGLVPFDEYLFYPLKDCCEDSLKAVYDLWLNVRYTDECRIKYLPLNIEIGSLDSDSIRMKQLNVPLFNENGHLGSKGNLNLFNSQIKIIENLHFEEGFFMAVSTPESHTKGIIAIGVTSQFFIQKDNYAIN